MDTLDLTNDEYLSPPRRVGFFARLFPSFVFHGKFLRIVLAASRLAQRGLYDHKAWQQSCENIIRALESVGVRLEITGLDHMRAADKPCLVVGNHVSTLETVVLPVLLRDLSPITFVVFAKLLELPVFKHVMRSRDPIPVRQISVRDDFKEMLIGGVERIERGISLIIFPEGDRMPKFERENFNSIGSKLAARTSAPIVPMAVQTHTWPMGGLFGYIGRIYPSRPTRIAFGAPLQAAERGAEAQEALIEFIESKLAEWGTPASSNHSRSKLMGSV